MFPTVGDVEPAPAGGVLHQQLDTLDVWAADQSACVEALADYERCAAQLQARQHELLARLDQLNGSSRDDWTREEVAAALGIAPLTAKDRLVLSRVLYHRLAETWRLLRDGALTVMHARVLAHAVDENRLTAEQTADVQTWVLRKPDLPVGEFKARLRYALAKYAPVPVEEAQAAARAARTVWHKPGEHDAGVLMIHGPVDATWLAWTMIDDLAHHPLPTHTTDCDERTLDQRRFDAFTDLFLGQRAWQRLRPTVEVTVPLDTLQGGDTPGELVGYGPISADTARHLATHGQARWRRLVYDRHTGGLLACGEQTYPPGDRWRVLTDPVEAPPGVEAQYRPSARLARYVRARDRRCLFPGCRRKARRTDLDHTIPYRVGGPTSLDNLHPLCERHHRLKDEHTGWTLANNPDGSTTWTSPTGRSYVVWPHDYNGP